MIVNSLQALLETYGYEVTTHGGRRGTGIGDHPRPAEVRRAGRPAEGGGRADRCAAVSGGE